MTDQRRSHREVEDTVSQLVDRVERLRNEVDMLLTRPPTIPAHGGWEAMGPITAAHTWTALVGFVDQLVTRYALDDTIPVCWYAHGIMVDELHALHRAWLAAHTDGAARLRDPADWHAQLAGTLDRLRGWDRHGCTSGTHRPDQPLALTADARATRNVFIHTDIQDRARRDGESIEHIPPFPG